MVKLNADKGSIDWLLIFFDNMNSPWLKIFTSLKATNEKFSSQMPKSDKILHPTL